jgi:hypothetical protein
MPTNLRHTRLGGRSGGLYAATGGTPAPGVPGGSSLLTDLVSYWKLDEASGNATDSHGANTLTDTNTVTTAAGKQGTARQFTAASTEYFTIADNTDLSTGDIDFTIAAWAYLDSSLTAEGIVGKWTGGSLEYWLGYVGGSTSFAFQVSTNGSDNPSVTGPGSMMTATWYFLVAWHDSVLNTINIQVNDGTVVSVAHTAGVFNGTAAFRIGYDGTWPMSGRVDEVGFWKKVLSAAERTALYGAGSGAAYPFTGLP